jgi:lysophospholipase L1-like esterase
MKIIKNNWLALIVIAILSIAWSKPLPKLFLTGDSIAGHYKPFLAKYLTGYVQLESKKDDGHPEENPDIPSGSNGGDSRMVLASLQEKVKNAAFNPDYLLLNCGLHDIKRDLSTNKIQVSEQEYRKNLEAIVQLLQKKQIQLIWIRTTPVVDSIHNAKQSTFHRYAIDVKLYNQIADEVCAKNKVPVIDLFTFTEKLGIDQFADHVHYKEPARNLQAAFIAGSIISYLNSTWIFN